VTKANSTDIIIVLDRSGSMSGIAADMEGGFKAFVEEQKKLPGECHVTLAQFDNEYEIVYERRPIAEVPPLKLEPRGSTALLDAVGRTIDATGQRLASMKEEDRPSRVAFVIITDGYENASREYTRERVFEMIKAQQEKFSWEFVFMGASKDAYAQAASFGIQAENAVAYVAQVGAQANAVFQGVSSNLSSYRGGQGLGNLQASYNAAANQDDAANQANQGSSQNKSGGQ
jgi:uncharacterized protein YegL